MIRYALRCDKDHAFDSWFRSAADFDALVGAGRVACPDCGGTGVAKALMAPSVAPEPVRAEGRALTSPATRREAALADLRRHIAEKSEYVGMRFAAEARAIHDGDAPERAIHGEARPDEARALIEDGVPVAPLPFLPAGKVN
ncbi:MAG: DUF1178 family protein [Gemmobacter sp.]